MLTALEACNVMCCRDCIREEHETHIYKILSGGLVERQRRGLSEHAQQLRSLGASLQDSTTTLNQPCLTAT
ncbi:trim71 [Symbiodinium natans]|uniref:Trim71 protein n=1 Tax=Symbiodinium natans TaxID=878477 RepID=A0A812UKJ4_9DINO|nr:trim71 [Symbiodinium natans]